MGSFKFRNFPEADGKWNSIRTENYNSTITWNFYFYFVIKIKIEIISKVKNFVSDSLNYDFFRYLIESIFQK